MVPIVEPEVLMDGGHSAEECYKKTSEVIKKCLDSGAKIAKPGEFTLRAFLNNKRISWRSKEKTEEMFSKTKEIKLYYPQKLELIDLVKI